MMPLESFDYYTVCQKEINKGNLRMDELHLAFLWSSATGKFKKAEVLNEWKASLKTKSIPAKLQLVPQPQDEDFLYMPSLSFMLQIPFQLAKPYISKDDCYFHLCENPVRKEKVFRAPMVAATSWKGALRAALRHISGLNGEDLIRLLGNERENEKQQAGSLYFFPTYFDQISVEVIHPHERKTGTGINPIWIEMVPVNATGSFSLLYVPCYAQDQNHNKRDLVAQDLETVATGIKAMLLTYGFGAKTSSGFGTAQNQLAKEGCLTLRAALPELDIHSETASNGPPPKLARYLETPDRLIADLRAEDGSLKSEADYKTSIESRGLKYKKKNVQLYKKALNWWEREGLKSTEEQKEAKPETTKPSVAEYQFSSLEALCILAQELAKQLRNGGTV